MKNRQLETDLDKKGETKRYKEGKKNIEKRERDNRRSQDTESGDMEIERIDRERQIL